MTSRIIREKRVGEKLQLLIESDDRVYAVYAVPARGANHEVVGYRAWIGNAQPIGGDRERAEQAALRAVEAIYDPEFWRRGAS